MKAGWTRATVLALAIGALVLVVPVQGVRDRLGAAGDRPPSSGAADYDTAAIDLVSRGAWWRVEPDYSYFLVMHDRFASGARGSPPLVSTYGPWGFLYRGATPETYLPALAAWAFLAACLVAVAALAGRERETSPGPEAFRLAGLVVALAAMPRELTLLLLPAGLAAGPDEEGDAAGRAIRSVAAAGAALAALVKHNALAIALVALAVLVGRRLVARRGPGPEPFVFAAAFLAFLSVAGERIGDLPAYAANALAVVASYTEASSIPTEPEAVPGLLLAAGLLAAVVAAEALRAARRRDGGSVVEAVGTAAIALAVFKSGALRASNAEHLVLARSGLAALALLRLPAWAAALRPGPGSRRLLTLGAGAAALVALPFVPRREIARQLAAWSRPAEARRASDARCAADLAAIRLRNPLPPIRGPVDLLENRQSILLAHGLDYRPRPVFQSYLATGERLSGLNARHLAGPAAPEHVLFEAWSIDGRLLALDDALAWLQLLRRYDVEAVSDRFALLRLRPSPRALAFLPAGTATARLGEAVAVPLAPGRRVRLTARVAPTLAGRLLALVYKVPELEIRLRLADGRVTRWRFVRAAGETGFLLSPSVEGALDMALLLSERPELASKAVTAVAIGLADGGSPSAYRNDVEYRFEEVVLREAPVRPADPPRSVR